MAVPLRVIVQLVSQVTRTWEHTEKGRLMPNLIHRFNLLAACGPAPS
jgi:hypothetical protein